MVSDTFDHTSQLKLIRARFGVPVPNMTAWRDGVVGDMTSAFNLRLHEFDQTQLEPPVAGSAAEAAAVHP